MLGVLRSNLDDNLEFNAKFGAYEGGSEALPFKLGVMAGVALNTDPFLIGGAEDNEAQLYGQLMINVLVGDRLAIGIVPTYLRNPRIRDLEAENAFALGLHGQVYRVSIHQLPGRVDRERSASRERQRRRHLRSRAGDAGALLQNRPHESDEAEPHSGPRWHTPSTSSLTSGAWASTSPGSCRSEVERGPREHRPAERRNTRTRRHTKWGR